MVAGGPHLETDGDLDPVTVGDHRKEEDLVDLEEEEAGEARGGKRCTQIPDLQFLKVDESFDICALNLYI